MDFGATLIGAAATAGLIGAGAFAHATWSRANRTTLIVGSIAHVAVTIPENGVGLIALVVGSRRTTLPARHHDGHAVPRGTEVAIVEMSGRVAVVAPIY
ncbi:MAG TPA: hypothetical protein VHC69_25250 [Polyangiaceae bacterium]|nr:hypothetical protein [Polyangiaceae bacterium]